MSTPTEAPKGGHVFDLAIGESTEVKLSDGASRRLTLLDVHEPRCAVRGIIRFPQATVDIDGERADVPAGLYHLPQTVNGVRVGCSVTGGVAKTVARYRNVYALDSDARIRCWDPEGFLFDATPLVYPAGQTWFASMTQMANERVYVDGGELSAPDPKTQYIYHHFGMDIGGHEKAVPILAARGGRVVCRGEDVVPGYDEEAAGQRRYDKVSSIWVSGGTPRRLFYLWALHARAVYI